MSVWLTLSVWSRSGVTDTGRSVKNVINRIKQRLRMPLGSVIVSTISKKKNVTIGVQRRASPRAATNAVP